MKKIIHQVFFNIGLKPFGERQDYKNNIKLIKKMNPTWAYKLWNDESANEFVEEYYPEHVKTWYSFIHPMYKVDYIRYLILDHYGGIYIDLDETPIKPLDSYITSSKIITGTWYSASKKKFIEHNNNIIAINDKKLTKDLIKYVGEQIIEKKKSIPACWKCRLFQHSVGQRCFTRWCKKNKHFSDINTLNYFETTNLKNNCSWLTSFGKKNPNN